MHKSNFVLLEGSRGTGKSTVSHLLRQSMKDSTLINFTGFNIDGAEGLLKITDYYLCWLQMFHKMNQINQTIICDRIFFSEMVFSKLYKSYDFSMIFELMADKLAKLNPTIFHLTISDEKELSLRLQRDKLPFYKVEESVKETFRQQLEYESMFERLKEKFNIITIDTTNFNPEQVKNIILSKL